MSDMKCPFCHKEIRHAISVDTHNFYWCENYDCDASSEMIGTEYMWASLIASEQELITTRKALDLAINVLNRVKDVKYEEYIDEKLEQINEITKGGKDE